MFYILHFIFYILQLIPYILYFIKKKKKKE